MKNKLLLLIFFLFTSTTKAQNTNCLFDTKGKSLRWNSSWQNDNQDNKVSYTISEVTKDPTAKSIVVELNANSKANLSKRLIVVYDEIFAQTLCDRIIAENGSSEAKQSEDLKNLSFIKFYKNTWILAEVSQKQTLATCYVYSKKYLCTLDDKLNHSQDLKKIEEELKFEVE